MSDISLQRERVRGFFKNASKPHAGLWLSRGLQQWKNNKTHKGEDFLAHVEKATGLAAPDVYRAAYQRWQGIVLFSNTMAFIPMTLQGRLFIGMGGPSVIESAITLSHAYGVPMIPASALKGLTSVYAKALEVDPNTCSALFGKEGKTPDECDAGYVIFHDAWWMPNSHPPLAQEIVTPHHPDYYQKNGGQDATDFDSPEPNVQIAAKGSFLFAVECSAKIWADYALGLLTRALIEWGVGGKTSAGYGRFNEDIQLSKQLADDLRKLADKQKEVERNRKRDLMSVNQQTIDDLYQKRTPNFKDSGPGSQLYRDTRELIEQAALWNDDEKGNLYTVAVEIFDWIGIQKDNKNRKSLLRSLRPIP